MTRGEMPPPPPPPPPPPLPAIPQLKLVIETVKISDIKIGSRLRKKPTNIESLAASIDRNGLLHPISVTSDNTLIGGHRRIKAFEYLGRTEIPCIVVTDPKINPTRAEYDENVERADFALEDIAEIYRLVESSRIGHRPKKEEEEQEIENNDNNKVGKLPTFPFPKGPTDIVTGNIVGHSEKTVNKIVKLVEAAKENPELQHLVDQVDDGDKRINAAYTEMIRAQDRDIPKPKPPEGQYDIILCDPPWTYDVPGRGTPQNHYPVMSDEEIMALPIPAAENAVLFVWTTMAKLDVTIDVIRAWGFKYKTNLAWVKDKIGTGYYFRGKHEHLLLAVKGAGLGVPAEANRRPSVLLAPRIEHSRKPTEVYEIIEKMYPNRTYIELFARGQPREGWKTWGLEATEAVEEEEK